MNILIIGGTGKIGSFFRSIFEDAKVINSKNYSQLKTYAKNSSHILLCVPQEKTRAIIEDLKEVLTNQVVIDTSSSMNAPLDTLSCPSAYLHPLFAPGVDAQKKIVCVCKTPKLLIDLLQTLEENSIQIIHTTKEEHEKAMAYVQALSHFTGIVFAKTLADSHENINVFDFTTPYFQLLIDTISRIFAQEPTMYAHIQFENKAFIPILKNFITNTKKLSQAVSKKNEKEYIDIFEKVKKKLPQILEKHYTESQKLLKSLHTSIAVLGPKGSFSDFVASKLGMETKYAHTFSNVALMIENNEVTCGLLPIENSIGGSIADVCDIVVEHKLKINQEIIAPISHCAAGYRVDTVETILSHPQALAQCTNFLKKYPHAKIERVSSTAQAFKEIKENKRKNCLAIGTEFAARLYNLQIYERNIEDNSQNKTRFIIVSQKANKKGDKSTLVIKPKIDRPGLLYEMLKIFYDANLNLSRIESRPIKDLLGTYMFHIDVNIKNNRQGYICALEKLKTKYTVIELGEYNEFR
ncbi:MAG: prephenate dehydratase [Candidatus Woesearchaeota archaeon]